MDHASECANLQVLVQYDLVARARTRTRLHVQTRRLTNLLLWHTMPQSSLPVRYGRDCPAGSAEGATALGNSQAKGPSDCSRFWKEAQAFCLDPPTG